MPGYFRMRRDLTEPIAAASFPSNVVLVDFDPDQELFAVAACPELEDLPRKSLATRTHPRS